MQDFIIIFIIPYIFIIVFLCYHFIKKNDVKKEMVTIIEKYNQASEKIKGLSKINEVILIKALKEIKQKKSESEEKNAEILTQNEELMQTQEKLIAQREFIEKQHRELEHQNKTIKANESVLLKAVEKLKKKEAEIKLQKADLEEKNAEILTQNEELMQTQEELMAQREFIEKQHKELQHQNGKVNNSIQSALLIQQAMLPCQQEMNRLLGQYFIIYKPKDIVSGDFWWLNEVDEKIYLASVDCTGHGVAGAFMTMIGNTLLDKIIRLKGIRSPAGILEMLHEEVQNVLRQKETHNNSGMDMSLVCIEREETYSQLTFAGAKQSLYFIYDEKGTIEELKGDRKAIGGEQNQEKFFTNHNIQLKKGTWIYMGSDGLYDQNNPKRKRLGEKLLKEILLRNHHFPPLKQRQLLENALNEHQQNAEQRDDILWIGVKL